MTGSLYALDTSDLRPSYVLDCDSGVQIRLSELAQRVVAARWSGTSFADIASACSDGQRRLTEEDVRHVHERVVSRVELAEDGRRTRWSGRGVFLRLKLFPSALVGRIAAPFAALFHLRVALAATLLLCCAVAYALATQKLAWPDQTPGDLLAGYGLFLVSCLAHEFGHAGACKRMGVRPGSIGVALYLVFPAFYSDVTRIWRLKRGQRVAVDVAGIYVQCLCAAVYLLVYVQTHAAAWYIAIAFIVAAVLIDLNPLFRFDGYWIVSDALGISELHAQAGSMLRRLIGRVAGLESATAPAWPKATTVAVALYSFVALGFWVWFAGGLLARTVAQGRWTFMFLAAVAKHQQELSFGFAGQLAGMLAGSLTLAYFSFVLLRFVLAGVQNARGIRECDELRS